MLKKTALYVAGFAVAATAVFAGGHSMTPEQAAIKARQSHMFLYQHNFGILGGMARGNVDYDADAAMAAANNLNALATMSQAGYWLPGSDNSAQEGTRALPDLWANMSDVGRIAGELVAATEGVQAAAGNGLEALQGSLGPLGAACTACHKEFRASQ